VAGVFGGLGVTRNAAPPFDEFLSTLKAHLGPRKVSPGSNAPYLVNRCIELFQVFEDIRSGGFQLSVGSNEQNSENSLVNTSNAIIFGMLELFVLNVVRLYRVIDHGHREIALDSEKRRAFMKLAWPLVDL
jgi:hypothetical protein